MVLDFQASQNQSWTFRLGTKIPRRTYKSFERGMSSPCRDARGCLEILFFYSQQLYVFVSCQAEIDRHTGSDKADTVLRGSVTWGFNLIIISEEASCFVFCFFCCLQGESARSRFWPGTLSTQRARYTSGLSCGKSATSHENMDIASHSIQLRSKGVLMWLNTYYKHVNQTFYLPSFILL